MRCWHAVLFCLALHLFPPSNAVGGEVLQAAGATFPYPLYRKWFKAYEQLDGTRITYEAVGSGKGIEALLSQAVDFGGTDAFLSDSDLSQAPAPVLHIPTCMGAVAITYNLPGRPALRFSPQTLARIFSGRITLWSDRRLRADNPGVELPALPITVVHRSDGSGTTFVLTSYLSRIAPAWKQSIGCGKRVAWPTGLGLEGNPRVAEYIGRVEGSIGYVQLTYAARKQLPLAAIRNQAGRYVQPDLRTVSAAATALPDDTRALLVDSAAPDAYPIAALTWIILYAEQQYGGRSPERAAAVYRFLQWALRDGQAYNRKLLYAPLPGPAVKQAEAILQRLRYGGKPLEGP